MSNDIVILFLIKYGVIFFWLIWRGWIFLYVCFMYDEI